jgi:hypothetical protein
VPGGIPLAEQAERARTNRIFVAVPMFLVAARVWRSAASAADAGATRASVCPPPTRPSRMNRRPPLPGDSDLADDFSYLGCARARVAAARA